MNITSYTGNHKYATILSFAFDFGPRVLRGGGGGGGRADGLMRDYVKGSGCLKYINGRSETTRKQLFKGSHVL